MYRDFMATCRQLNLHPTPDQRRAASYLEDNGKRFLVDYGLDNAVANAREHWKGLKGKNRPKGHDPDRVPF